MTTPTLQNIIEKQVEKLKGLNETMMWTSQEEMEEICHTMNRAIKESIAEAFEATRIEFVDDSSKPDQVFEHGVCCGGQDALTEQREKQDSFLKCI